MADKRKTNKADITQQIKLVDTELKDGVFIFTGNMSINEFAKKIGKSANEIITLFFKRGQMFNINHILNEEAIAELCLEYGYDFQKEVQVDAANVLDTAEVLDEDTELVERPPVITVMGHVDHGKTTLIDFIRKSAITKGEAGGITQHTGAYQVEHDGAKITFLDTPGHEAFSSMRARGAKLTDIVIIVVAADDGVMPQTKEAIIHAKASNDPIIVFVNKMDKQGIDVERVKSEMSAEDVICEEWGGDVPFVYGSALKGEGIEELFEQINVNAEMLELKANPERMAMGVIVESRVDKGRGAIATVIVQNGTLLKRDFMVAGGHYGKVRSMENSKGESIEEAKPGTPVVITGLNYSPMAGQKFVCFKDEKFAKKLAEEKKMSDRQKDLKSKVALIDDGEGKKILNIIVKTDVQGTSEAIKATLSRLENEEAKVRIISSGIGLITKSDVILAEAAQALIVAFNVKPTGSIKSYADKNKIEIMTHNIIYKIVEDVQKILTGMQAPKYEEQIIGEAVILMVIPASKIGNIAGSTMVKGMAKSKCGVRLKRRGKLIHEGYLDSLKRGPDDAKKVEQGKEFGCHIRKFNEIEVDDILEFFEMVEVPR